MTTISTQRSRVSDALHVPGIKPRKELSGRQWVSRFRGSTSTADLAEPFRSATQSFIKAVEAAGGRVSISATYRPPERAYLMHYACLIAKGQIAPDKVPAMKGVDIEWAHPSAAASRSAAAAMAFFYQIVHPPALDSNHTRRLAIDMTIKSIVGKTVIDATGARITIARLSDLNAIGATYGVIKLVVDRPHWSSNGR